MDVILKIVVGFTSLFVFRKIISLYFENKESIFETPKKIKLLITGFVANVCDTLGIGSFAVVVAFNSRWRFVDDKQLPGTLNGHGIFPAMLQSLLFLQVVEVDLRVLISFVSAACAGAFCSSYVVSRLNQQTIRLIMAIGFIGISLLILASQLNILPVAGEATTLPTSKILLGIPIMMIIGMFPSVGIGMYVPIQVVMFLMGFSPLVAFPVMATAGALVQATSAYVFATNKEVCIRESLLMGLSGTIGVLLIVPFITYVNITTLRWILLTIVLYNAVSIWQTYQSGKKALAKSL